MFRVGAKPCSCAGSESVHFAAPAGFTHVGAGSTLLRPPAIVGSVHSTVARSVWCNEAVRGSYGAIMKRQIKMSARGVLAPLSILTLLNICVAVRISRTNHAIHFLSGSFLLVGNLSAVTNTSTTFVSASGHCL